MALTLVITRVTPLYPEGFFLQWTLQGLDPRVGGVYQFVLERSGGPVGPWEAVGQPLPDTYSALDRMEQPVGTAYRDTRRANVFGLNRAIYYRVRVTTPTGETAEAVTDTSPDLDPKMAQYWRKGLYNFAKAMRVNGVPIAVCKRRRWGTRCPVCVDKVVREPLRGACTTCYGTGFTDGFFTPVWVRGQRGAPGNTSLNTPEGRQDSNGVIVRLPHSVMIEQGDVLVFSRDGKRFMCDRQGETQISTTTIHQLANVTEIPRDNVIYRVRVDTTSPVPMI